MAAGDIGMNIRKYLIGVSAVNDALGTSGGVYAEVLPQNAALPAVVFSLVSSSPQHHFGSTSTIRESRLQIDVIDRDRENAFTVSELIRINLDHYSGAAGDDTIDVALAVSDRTDIQPPRDGSATNTTGGGQYTYSTDYMIWHSVPAVST